MMFAKGTVAACAAACGVALAAGAAFGDAVMLKSGQTWNSTSTNLWQGPVPTFGPGVPVTFGLNGGMNVWLSTNVTVGSLTVPATVTPGKSARYDVYPGRYRDTTSVDPTYGSYKWQEHGETITFDSGSDEPAVLGCLVPAQSNRYRLYTHVPIRMASDLMLAHLGFNGHPGGSSGDGEHVSLGVLGDISDDGGTHTLITHGPWIRWSSGWYKPAIDVGGKNTFSGDVDLRGWTRLLNREGVHDETSGTQLGRDNSVYATNDYAVLDLGGNTYTADHHLYIGGYTPSTNSIGRLTSTYGSPNATAVWKGPVTLTGSTAIGGGCGEYPLSGFLSALRIEGDVDDAKGTSGLKVLGARDVTFAGKIDIGGRISRTAGEISFEGDPGLKQHQLQLSSTAVYRMKSADDPDPSVILYTNAVAANTIRLRLDGDFTFTPQNGFTNLYYLQKTGRGTLVMNKKNKGIGGNNQMDVYSLEGDTVFDYTENDVSFLSGHTYFVTLGAGYGGRFILKTKSNQKNICDWSCPDWSTGEIVKEGAAVVYAACPQRNGTGLLNYLVKGGSLQGDRSRQDLNLTTAPGTWGEANFWSNRTWIAASEYVKNQQVRFIPFTAYTNDWTRGTCFIDVTPELLEDPIPADTAAAAWRFNTPPASGDTMTLTLSGTNVLTSGTILVTPDFGADKTLRITGGALTRPTAGSFRIVSYATNLTVEIASDLVQTNRANAVSFGVYNCTVKFTGNSEFNGTVGIVNGILDVCDNRFMGSPALKNGAPVATQRVIAFTQGGRLRTHGDFTLQRDADGVAVRPYFRVLQGVGKLDVADGTLTSGASRGSIQCYDRAVFEKCGAGHFNMANAMYREDCQQGYGAPDHVARYLFSEGRVTFGGSSVDNFAEKATLITVSNGVTVAGVAAFDANAGGANGGGSIIDGGSRMAYRIGPGGVVFDLAGSSRAVGAGGGELNGYEIHPSGDFYVGEGDVVITNTVDNAAYYTVCGGAFTRLTGTFRNHAPMTALSSDGGEFILPNAVYDIPEGKAPYFYQLVDGYRDLRIGRLTGSGTLSVYARNNYADPVAYLGRDANETFTFGGRFVMGSLALGSHASARLVKVGSNAMRLTNPNGTFTSTARIAAGDVLIACEPTGDQAGALGSYDIYLCDKATPANAVPRLLTDGPYAVANNVRVLAQGAASARPALGGASATEDSSFTGSVRLWRDLALHSAGGTVTFSGAFLSGDGEPHALAKTGPGKVVVSGAVATLAGLELDDGLLELTQPCEVPSGATLAVDCSRCTEENRDRTFRLLSTPGGMTGKFTLSTALPDGWRVRQTKTGITLSWGRRGLAVHLR